MEDRKLTPADDKDLVQSLTYALRFDRSGKRVSLHHEVMAHMAAERIVEALKLSGYVVMRGPPAQSAAEAAARASQPVEARLTSFMAEGVSLPPHRAE